MGALPIDSRSGVTHDADALALFHGLARRYYDGTQVRIQTVIRRAVPAMLDHHVFSVVGIGRDRVDVRHPAGSDGAHFIERFAERVAMHRANIDSFVKSGVNED